MTNVLDDHAADLELVTLVCRFFNDRLSCSSFVDQALECMSVWPLLNRNKVEDSKVSVPVRTCAELEDETVKGLAQKVSLVFPFVG